MKYLLEYIWIDGNNTLRSKNRIISFPAGHSISIANLPIWNFDGSSTNQAQTADSERFLKPVYICNNPFTKDIPGLLVMCAVYNDIGLTMPSTNNHFEAARVIFDKYIDTDPWFGFEQEFFLFQRDGTNMKLVPPQLTTMDTCREQGQYYCSVGAENSFGREVITSFIDHCILAELSLYGTNAEVAPGQWEFQIGTVKGIVAAHELWIARYILLRISESYDICVSFHPKPYSNMNGSGCHTNFSNRLTRGNGGFETMKKMFEKLETTHKEHIDNYGSDNSMRLTGIHETSNMEKCTWSVAGRHTSIRVGQEVAMMGSGYFEDRRPASNCDPYLVSSLLVKNTIV